MKKISFGLSVKSIQNAIEEIEDYQRSFNKKVEEFVTELSKYGRIVAMEKVQESPLGKTVTLRCETTPEEMGCKAILIATGIKTGRGTRTIFNIAGNRIWSRYFSQQSTESKSK